MPDVAQRPPFVSLLAGFAAELRAAGLAVGSGDVLTYCSALAGLDIRSIATPRQQMHN